MDSASASCSAGPSPDRGGRRTSRAVSMDRGSSRRSGSITGGAVSCGLRPDGLPTGRGNEYSTRSSGWRGTVGTIDMSRRGAPASTRRECVSLSVPRDAILPSLHRSRSTRSLRGEGRLTPSCEALSSSPRGQDLERPPVPHDCVSAGVREVAPAVVCTLVLPELISGLQPCDEFGPSLSRPPQRAPRQQPMPVRWIDSHSLKIATNELLQIDQWSTSLADLASFWVVTSDGGC